MNSLFPNIQVFAGDVKMRQPVMPCQNNMHGHQPSKWTLPYMRLGADGICDSVLTDCGWYQQLHLPVSEFNGMCKIASNLPDFGNPDYVGFCHYRRFFTASTTKPLAQFEQDEVDPSIPLSPMQQLCIIVQNNAVGIVPFPFLEHYKQDPKCKHYNTNPNNLAEYYYLQLEEDHVGLTLDDVQFALDRLVEFLPDSFKPFVQQAMQMRAVHFCNLFTMRTDLFIEMFNVVFKALNALMIHIGHDRLMTMNCRCVGYLSERLFSVLIWVLKLRGERLMNMPIAVASCTSNPAYRSKTLADTGVECDIDGLKHAIEATNA